jgi:hypothetical protein
MDLRRNRVEDSPNGSPRPSTPAGEGPDFIVIGAMKCATTTLHEQLSLQPGVFMSQPKEPNFFSDDENAARGLEWYRSLFREAAPGDLRGESSTHYTKRPTYPRTVERMKRAFPRLKLIYVMRHPVDRLVSQYVHDRIRESVPEDIDAAIDAHRELTDYSRYAFQIEPYLRAYGPQCLLPVFFERLVAQPQEELDRIGRFLGYQGQLRWDFERKPKNVTSEQLRKSALREAMMNSPTLNALRRRLIPRGLTERVKQLWRVGEDRPWPSPRAVERLETLFDADLAILGSWLGIPLDCRNFHAAALAGGHAWSAAIEGS